MLAVYYGARNLPISRFQRNELRGAETRTQITGVTFPGNPASTAGKVRITSAGQFRGISTERSETYMPFCPQLPQTTVGVWHIRPPRRAGIATRDM